MGFHQRHAPRQGGHQPSQVILLPGAGQPPLDPDQTGQPGLEQVVGAGKCGDGGEVSQGIVENHSVERLGGALGDLFQQPGPGGFFPGQGFPFQIPSFLIREPREIDHVGMRGETGRQGLPGRVFQQAILERQQGVRAVLQRIGQGGDETAAQRVLNPSQGGLWRFRQGMRGYAHHFHGTGLAAGNGHRAAAIGLPRAAVIGLPRATRRARIPRLAHDAPGEMHPVPAVMQQFPWIRAPVRVQPQFERAGQAQAFHFTAGKEGAEQHLPEVCQEIQDFGALGQGQRLQGNVALEALIGLEPFL